jgi:signal transduction histidine kinase
VVRARRIAGRILGVLRARAALIDAGAAAVLSAVAVAGLPRGLGPGEAAAGAACALAATTSVGWRARAPEAAVVIAGAATAGYAWLADAQSLLAEALTLLLVMYTAGSRGVSRRQFGQLAALVTYGIAVCVLVNVAMGPLSMSAVAVHALPVVVAPAAAGLLVARQRALAGRLAAATEQLRAGQGTRLAVVRTRERNRVARELHDVVAHGVSVMVVQAGVARITVQDEPDLARAALEEVTGAGRAALAELRRILGIMDAADHATGPPFGVGPPCGVPGIVALAERRRAAGLPVQICVTGTDPGFPAAVDTALYRLVQEALTNVIKHAGSAPTDVDVAIEPAVLRVRVRNSAANPDAVTVADDSGHGLAGMRERVESCQGQLWYGPQPSGGFEVRAEFPLSRPGFTADGSGTRLTAGQVRTRAGWAASRARMVWARAGPVVTLAVLCADACISADRRGPLALNIVLVAGMSLALLWRRRSPLWFLIAVNLLALGISNGLASISNPTLVSTYVFVVPVWAVAAWSAAGAAVAGLALTVAFDAGEGLYWHLGSSSIAANVLLAGALWIAGRAVRRQRLMAADLERTRSLVEAEQQAREELALAAERTRMVARLNSLVDEEVSAMIVASGSVTEQIGGGAATGEVIVAIAEIERAGRQGLARLRQILGLLRAEYDPEQLVPQPVLADLHDLPLRPART